MPVRKRRDMRRKSEVEAWYCMLRSGFDFFHTLSDVGLTEEKARPLAEATWRRIGTDVLEYHAELYRGFPPDEEPLWAEAEYGPPSTKRRPGR